MLETMKGVMYGAILGISLWVAVWWRNADSIAACVNCWQLERIHREEPHSILITSIDKPEAPSVSNSHSLQDKRKSEQEDSPRHSEPESQYNAPFIFKKKEPADLAPFGNQDPTRTNVAPLRPDKGRLSPMPENLLRRNNGERVPSSQFPSPHTRWYPADGNVYELGSCVGKGLYAVVFELKGRSSEVIKIYRLPDDESYRSRFIERIKRGHDLLRQYGIPQLEIAKFAPLPLTPYVIQAQLAGDMVTMRSKEAWSIEGSLGKQEAVLELFRQFSTNGLTWEDGHLGNIFFERIPGSNKWRAGVLDQDGIEKLNDVRRIRQLTTNLPNPDFELHSAQRSERNDWSVQFPRLLSLGLNNDLVKSYFPDIA